MRKKKILDWYGSGGGIPDTTPDGRQAVLFLGDSTSASVTGITTIYAGSASIPGTCFSSDGSVITELTDAPQVAIKFNELTAKKMVVISTGVPSATIYPNGNNNNWYTSGDNYAAAKTKANNTLTLLNLTKLKGIVINLGINDAVNSAQLLADVSTGLTSLITRLIADFPGVPIIFQQIGRGGGQSAITARIAFIRNLIKQAAIDYPDVHLAGSFAAFFTQAGFYNADGLHLDQDGNVAAGDMAARWFYNSSYTKWARSIISSHFDELSSVRKTLINNFILSQETAFLNCDAFTRFKTTTKNNVFFDWSFLNGTFVDDGFSFVANSHIATNGSTTFFRSGYNPSVSHYKSTQTDIFAEIKIKQNNTAGGTNAYACGLSASGGANMFALGQVSSNTYSMTHTAFSNALIYEVDNGLTASSYLQSRNSGDEFIYKDGVQVDTRTSTVTALLNGEELVGALNQLSLAIGLFIDAQFTRRVIGKFTGVPNVASFVSALDTLDNNW